jgi:hypothetical protein
MYIYQPPSLVVCKLEVFGTKDGFRSQKVMVIVILLFVNIPIISALK